MAAVTLERRFLGVDCDGEAVVAADAVVKAANSQVVRQASLISLWARAESTSTASTGEGRGAALRTADVVDLSSGGEEEEEEREAEW